MSGSPDVLVLGGGIVGVSAALHLQARGLDVALVDRREPGRETSHGNAGLIETSAILPHPFPRGLRTALRLVLNRTDAVRTDHRFLPRLLPWLLAYRRASSGKRLEALKPAFRRLIAASLGEHRFLLDQAGAQDLLRKDGWLELCRTRDALDEADREAAEARALGVSAEVIDAPTLHAMEPALAGRFAGALHWTDTARITDPGALVARLAQLFGKRGGRVVKGDALALEQVGGGWRLPGTAHGALQAAHAVVALGPWSGDLTRRLGYRMPLAAKRGYHRHFRQGAVPLTRPVYVRDRSCLMVPAAAGLRVLTGVELAPRDAPPHPRLMRRMAECAQETLALGEAVEDESWLGSRPCLPDMLPVIGPAPRHAGLWLAFGHGHFGFTQGPLTGRLIAELVTGETPLLPVDPYSAARFRSGSAPRIRKGPLQ